LAVAGAEPLKQYEQGKPRENWAPRTDENGEVLWRVLLAEDGLPVWLRSFCLDDQGLDGLAERACALRADAWLAGQTPEREAAV
jgi:hypothetical protein